MATTTYTGRDGLKYIYDNTNYTLTINASGSNTVISAIDDTVIKLTNSGQVSISYLKSCTISSGVTGIANGSAYNVGAFKGCTQLTTVSFPNTLTSIGDWAFTGCTALTSLTLPSSLTHIGGDAFGNTGVTSVTIPNSVTEIEGSAFGSCANLSSVTIGSGVQTISGLAFERCPSLTTFTVNSSNQYLSASDGVLFNKNKTVLKIYPYGKTNTSYTVPSGVTTIGEYAFVLNPTLRTITLPSSLTTIETSAFAASRITSMTIPEGVTTVGNYAFGACEYLTTISIPSTVTQFYISEWDGIPDNPFRQCYVLQEITVNANNQYYKSISGALFDKNCTTLYAYPIKKTDIYFSIPDTVTTIANYACSLNSSLTKIFISNTITNIGADAFSGCYHCSAIVFKGWNRPTIKARAFSLAASSAQIAEATVFSPDNWAEDVFDSTITGNAWTTINFRNSIPAVYIKSNGAWVRKGRGYLKISGAWVEDGTYFFKADGEWGVLSQDLFGT